MITPQIEQMLKDLEKNIKNGNYTPAKRIGTGTYVCVKGMNQFGVSYEQAYYDSLDPNIQAILDGHYLGDTIGQFKILGVFDVWPPNKPDASNTAEVKSRDDLNH